MKPFLKWAGGKSRLVPEILEALEMPGIASGTGKPRRLVEPFAGSGALVMGISQMNKTSDFSGFLCADANADLVNLYRHLRRDTDGFVALCRSYFDGGKNNDVDSYMRLRREFNEARKGSMKRSALFVYLNRHCFNGLCRYNGTGGFNVPFGRGANQRGDGKCPPPGFPEDAMRSFAEVGKALKITWSAANFDAVLARVEEGDVVYCDPPYSPLSPTASFSSYAKEGFSEADHVRLAETAAKLASERNVTVVISNHWSEAIVRDIYVSGKFAAPVIKRISAARSVAASKHSRGNASELFAIFRPEHVVDRGESWATHVGSRCQPVRDATSDIGSMPRAVPSVLQDLLDESPKLESDAGTTSGVPQTFAIAA